MNISCEAMPKKKYFSLKWLKEFVTFVETAWELKYLCRHICRDGINNYLNDQIHLLITFNLIYR